MKSNELYGIGVRLIGIYLLFLCIQTILKHLQMWQIYAFNGEVDIGSYGYLMVAEVLFIAVVGFVFIKFPLTIAKKINPKGQESTIEFTDKGQAILEVFVCILGIYILSWSIPDLLDNILFIAFNYGNERQKEMLDSSYISGLVTIVEILIGAFLCFRGDGFIKLMLHIRSLGS